MCSYDCEGPSAYWDSTPVARKPHKCCECGSMIAKGEKYYRVRGIWEGYFSTYKTCSVCEKVKNKARRAGVCLCFGELWETVGSDYEI